MKRLILLVLNY